MAERSSNSATFRHVPRQTSHSSCHVFRTVRLLHSRNRTRKTNTGCCRCKSSCCSNRRVDGTVHHRANRHTDKCGRDKRRKCIPNSIGRTATNDKKHFFWCFFTSPALFFNTLQVPISSGASKLQCSLVLLHCALLLHRISAKHSVPLQTPWQHCSTDQRDRTSAHN